MNLINMPRAAWKRQPAGILRPNDRYNYPGSLFFNSSCPSGYKFPYAQSGTINRNTYAPGIGVSSNTNTSFIATARPLQAITGLHTVVVACHALNAVMSYVSGEVDENPSYIEDILLNSQNETTSAGKIEVFLRSENNTRLIANTDVIFLTGDLLYFAFQVNRSGLFDFAFHGKRQTLNYTDSVPHTYITQILDYPISLLNRNSRNSFNDGTGVVLYAWARIPAQLDIESLSANPWQLFAPAPSRFYLIPSSGGATTYTTTLSIDALIQRAGLTQSTSIDALLQSAFSTSLSLDSLVAAVQSKTLSLDALLQIVGTRTISVDALLQAVKSGTVSIDALVQMTLAQNLSLDAFVQAGKTGVASLDALLSQSMSAAAVMDALIQASKSGAVSLDALITGSSATTIFTGVDALIQAIQSKTLSVDALLQKAYTSPLALDAYVALTQVKTVSLDALLQSIKTGTLSLDAIVQMTKTTMLSFDALIQAAKTGILSLDAILVFATQASVLLDAYVQKAVLRGVGLDAIIGAIADMVMPTGRVVAVPASDRWVFVTPSDRFIQV